MPQLIFLAGSTRKHSYNRRMAEFAAKLAEEKGANAEFIDLAHYDMPLFNEDLEHEDGLPEAARLLKKKFQNCDGFFIASPEYNSSITPLLKNTIDWISRKEETDEKPLSAFNGKVAALGSASPGGLGGLRGLVIVRMLLGNIGVHVCPTQVAVNFAEDAMNENGVIQKQSLSLLNATIDELIATAKAHKNARTS